MWQQREKERGEREGCTILRWKSSCCCRFSSTSRLTRCISTSRARLSAYSFFSRFTRDSLARSRAICASFLSTFISFSCCFILHNQLQSLSCSTSLMKKAFKETQTLRAGCSKAESKNFAPPQTPFPGAQDGQNLISWRRSLPSPTVYRPS